MNDTINVDTIGVSVEQSLLTHQQFTMINIIKH